MKKILVTIGVIAGMSLSFTMYSKTHTIRLCKVTQEHDKVVTVLHPNGESYDFFAYDSSSYIEDTIIKVSFNELKSSKDKYTVNSGNPNPVLMDIKNK